MKRFLKIVICMCCLSGTLMFRGVSVSATRLTSLQVGDEFNSEDIIENGDEAIVVEFINPSNSTVIQSTDVVARGFFQFPNAGYMYYKFKEKKGWENPYTYVFEAYDAYNISDFKQGKRTFLKTGYKIYNSQITPFKIIDEKTGIIETIAKWDVWTVPGNGVGGYEIGMYTSNGDELYVKDFSPIQVQMIYFNNGKVQMTEGDIRIEKVQVFPSDATNQNMNFTSSDSSILSVSRGGYDGNVLIMTSHKEGEVTVAVESVDGKKTATIPVEVKPAPKKVTGLQLNKDEGVLGVGEWDQLVATVSPDDAVNKAVNYSSSNSAVASVDANGLVTAKSVGEATITATSVDGGYQDTCKYTVSSTIKVDSIVLNKSTSVLEVGEKETLTATISPNNATNKDVVWSSSDEKVATVDANGEVSGIAVGNAKITATSKDGGKVSSSCDYEVKKTIKVTGIIMNKATTSLKVGQQETLNALVQPFDATNKKVIWRSSNLAIASVNANGVVNALSSGVVTIEAQSEDGGFIASCVVNVSDTIKVTGINLDKTTSSIAFGSSETLVAKVAPSNATNKKVTWSSSDPSIASVDANGVVKAIRLGVVTITAKSDDGNYVSSCSYTVSAPIRVEKVTINKSSLVLEVGAKEMLVATILPTNATNSKIIWRSGNEGVATVDSNGVVVGIKEGRVLIVGMSEDGGKTIACIVDVKSKRIANEAGKNPPNTTSKDSSKQDNEISSKAVKTNDSTDAVKYLQLIVLSGLVLVVVCYQKSRRRKG